MRRHAEILFLTCLMVACGSDAEVVTVTASAITSTTTQDSTSLTTLAPVSSSNSTPASTSPDAPPSTTAPSATTSPTTTTPATVSTSTAAQPDCTDLTDEHPPLLLATDSAVLRVEAGSVVPIPGGLDGSPKVAFSAGPDDVWVAVQGVAGVVDLARIQGGEVIPVITDAGGGALFQVVPLDDGPAALFATYPADEDVVEQGGSVVLQRADGSRTDMGVAFGPEYGVMGGAVGSELVVLSETNDLTETFSFLDLAGNDVDPAFNPTRGAPYNAPPFWTNAVLSPDDELLAWLEAPDVDGATDPFVLQGDWDLAIASMADSGELLRVTVAGQIDNVEWMDFDGRTVVLSVRPDGAPDPEVRLVDIAAPTPMVTRLCLPSGVATIDRFGLTAGDVGAGPLP